MVKTPSDARWPSPAGPAHDNAAMISAPKKRQALGGKPVSAASVVAPLSGPAAKKGATARTPARAPSRQMGHKTAQQQKPAQTTAQGAARPILRAPRASRERKQQEILQQAETLFARFGFEGVSLDDIAAELGVSRQYMLYYYASKEDLYAAVLGDVMESWLKNMTDLAQEPDHELAIRAYVRAKMRFSRERPSGTVVFTREVMSGAPRYGQQLAEQVLPHLRKDVQAFERWASHGLIERVDFTHLMFLIWSTTQAYADLAPHFSLVMGKPKLVQADFDAAEELITQLVVRSLRKQG